MAPMMMLKPTAPVYSSAKSSFSGIMLSFQNFSIAPSATGRSYKLDVQGKMVDLWVQATCWELKACILDKKDCIMYMTSNAR
jgi:hypothetical protein